MVTEDSTLDGEHTIKFKDDVLLNCMLKIYIILLTNVTPIILILKKDKRKF